MCCEGLWKKSYTTVKTERSINDLQYKIKRFTKLQNIYDLKIKSKHLQTGRYQESHIFRWKVLRMIQ